MKGKHYLLAGGVAGWVLGWAMGYLRVPYLENNQGFWVGFAAAVAGMFLFWAVWSLGARKRDKVPDTGNPGAAAPFWGFRQFATGLLVVTAVAFGIVATFQQVGLQKQLLVQQKKAREAAAMAERLKSDPLVPVMQHLLTKAGEEMRRSGVGKLSDSTINSIAALSINLKYYQSVEWDSLTTRTFNPHRGQLLLALLGLNIDSVSFERIKNTASFDGADLPGVDLSGLNLSNIRLRGANLHQAVLDKTNFSGADLEQAVFSKAILNGATLDSANLKRADLNWAQLREANLSHANLDGAILDLAQLLKANLSGASMQWAHAEGTMFGGATMVGANVTGCYLIRADLSQTILSGAVLKRIDWTESNLGGAVCDSASVEENWFDLLLQKRVVGLKMLQKNYEVALKPAKKNGDRNFWLKNTER